VCRQVRQQRPLVVPDKPNLSHAEPLKTESKVSMSTSMTNRCCSLVIPRTSRFKAALIWGQSRCAYIQQAKSIQSEWQNSGQSNTLKNPTVTEAANSRLESTLTFLTRWIYLLIQVNNRLEWRVKFCLPFQGGVQQVSLSNPAPFIRTKSFPLSEILLFRLAIFTLHSLVCEEPFTFPNIRADMFELL